MVHGAAAQHMRRAGKEPLTVQTPTTAQPSTSAHPTGMQSHIMPPSASVILQPNIVEESVPETPSRVQPVVTSSASPPAMHSQIFIPSGSDFDTSEGYDNQGGFVSNLPVDYTQLVDDCVRQSAARLAATLSVMRQVPEHPSQNEQNIVVEKELGIHVGSHGDGNGKHGNESHTNKEKELMENCLAR
jgi:hypothetical protein